jgi:hypothetical protein
MLSEGEQKEKIDLQGQAVETAAGLSVANGLPAWTNLSPRWDSSTPFRSGHFRWDDIKDTNSIVRANRRGWHTSLWFIG